MEALVQLVGHAFCLAALACTTLHRMSDFLARRSHLADIPERYIDMLRSAAVNFPASVYDPPPESASNAPILNLNLGGVNVSLGGAAGTGVYRTSNEGLNVQADGLRDGVMNLIGKVKQGVDRIAT